jgi:hypothetical protein
VSGVDGLVERLLKGGIIDVGQVRIAKSSLGPNKGPRFLIYLPTIRNYLWQALHASGHKVRVYIELPEGPLRANK